MVTRVGISMLAQDFNVVQTAISNDLISVLSFNPVSMLLFLNGMLLSMEKIKIRTY